ncbi:MAG: hypothetical protein ACYC96_10540 [Fimbriimonadaceae bacterium]
MLRALIAAAIAAVCVAGCGHQSGRPSAGIAGAAKSEATPPDPMEATREGMHEGAFLLGHAARDLERAIAAGKALQIATKNLDLKAVLVDILDKLDDAGGSIADYAGEPPTLAAFKKDFDAQDKKRLDSIDGANDAIHDVNVCDDALSDFTDNPAPGDDQPLSDLGDALDAATSDLTDAITAFGGKVEKDDTQTLATPDATTTPPKKPGVRPDL